MRGNKLPQWVHPGKSRGRPTGRPDLWSGFWQTVARHTEATRCASLPPVPAGCDLLLCLLLGGSVGMKAAIHSQALAHSRKPLSIDSFFPPLLPIPMAGRD